MNPAQPPDLAALQAAVRIEPVLAAQSPRRTRAQPPLTVSLTGPGAVRDDDVATLTLEDGSTAFMTVGVFRARLARTATRAADGAPESFVVPDAIPLEAEGARGGSRESVLALFGVERVTLPAGVDALWEHLEPGELMAWKDYARRLAIGLGASLAAWGICRWREHATLEFRFDGDPAEREGMLVLRTDGAAFEVERCLAPGEVAGSAAQPVSPLLVFVHGTASSTRGSFAELWREHPAIVRRLGREYGQVLGWEHRTLTASPVRNALGLLRCLPDGATVDLVSHSRGGLVGELLARGQPDANGQGWPAFEPRALDAFDQAGHPDAQALRELDALLARKAIRLRRFVRVACPARGTLLASERLDRYLGAISLALRWGTGLAGNPLAEGIDQFVKQVAVTRADPRILPGLEAQMPGSMLTRVLNDPTARTGADLHAISGNADASLQRPLHALAVILSNAFYLEANDFVVQTAAMTAGTPRSGPAWNFPVRGATVSHFGYFRNAESATQLDCALAGNDTRFQRIDVHADGMRAPAAGIEICRKPPAARLAEVAGKDPRPLVLVLPGIMGSELSIEGEERPTWFELGRMAWGGIRALAADAAAPAVATGVLPASYARLLAYLDKGKRFHPVALPFDWRGSLEAAAPAIRSSLDRALALAERWRTPVHLVAHSMGGIALRVALRGPQGQALRERFAAAGGRLLMLGVPNRGSLAPAAVLTTRDLFVGGIALIDACTSYRQIAGIAAGFQGLLELLPAGDWSKQCCNRGSLWDEQTWRAVRQADDRVAIPSQALLEAARRVADPQLLALELRQLSEDLRGVYVAGVADETPVRLLELDDAPAGPGEGPFGSANTARIVFEYSSEGDGRVSYDSGVIDATRTWVAPVAHGDLADAPHVFDAYAELLSTGATGRIPTLAAHRRTRAGERRRTGQAVEGEQIARLAALAPARIGAAIVSGHLPMTRPRPEARPLSVGVVHGNLEYARFPVLFGHYLDEHLSSAGLRIDEKLSGQLALLASTRLFRGETGQTAFLGSARDPHPPEAPGQADAQTPDAGAEQGARTGPEYPAGLRFGGAVALGLGRWGELTSEKLTKAVQRAVLRMAVDRSHYSARIPGQPLQLRLSSLLIGTGTRSISVRESVAAIVRGVRYAADQLVEQGLDERVGIAQLEFVELYEDSAHEAAHALNALLEAAAFEGWLRPATGERFEVEPRAGGRRRLFWEPDSAVFQRLSFARDRDGAVTVRYVSDRARSEQFSIEVASALVQGLVERAAASADPDVGALLYELLLPTSLKERFADFRDTELELDDDMSAIPWEVLCDSIGPADGFTRAEPLSVRAALIRRRVRSDGGGAARLAGGFQALVIGDPSLQGTAGFAQLPAAAREATEVAALLEASGFGATLLERPTASRVFSAILTGRHSVLHVAGHGTLEAEADADGEGRGVRAGIVLSDDARFTADDVGRIRRVPDLVFVNCCHLGRDAGGAGPGPAAAAAPIAGGPKAATFAASVGTRFIDLGARAVVVAGWTVNDQEAAQFARVFYQQMLAGECLARAVHAARAAVYRNNPRGLTWGAYQCYGDPEFRLQVRTAREPARAYVSARELAQEIRNRAANVTARTAQEDRRQVDRALAAGARMGWDAAPEVLAAHGVFLALSGESAAAIARLDQVLAEAPQLVDFETLEIYASLIVRRALAQPGRLDAAQAQAAIQRAKTVFDRIVALRTEAGVAPAGAGRAHAGARSDRATAAIELFRGSIALRATRIHLRCADRPQARAQLREALGFYGRALQLLQRRALEREAGGLAMRAHDGLASTPPASDRRLESDQAYALAAGLLSGVFLRVLSAGARSSARAKAGRAHGAADAIEGAHAVDRAARAAGIEAEPSIDGSELAVVAGQDLGGPLGLGALLAWLDAEAARLIEQLQRPDYVLNDFWDRSALAELRLSRAAFRPPPATRSAHGQPEASRLSPLAREIEESYREAIGCEPNLFEIDSIRHRFELVIAICAHAPAGSAASAFGAQIERVYQNLDADLAGR